MVVGWCIVFGRFAADRDHRGKVVAIHAIELNYLLSSGSVDFLLLYLGFSWAGVAHPLFFSFHLTDIIARSAILQKVLLSITRNGRRLAWTGVLLLIIVHMFTIVSFVGFRDMYVDHSNSTLPSCDTLLHCLLFTTTNGTFVMTRR